VREVFESARETLLGRTGGHGMLGPHEWLDDGEAFHRLALGALRGPADDASRLISMAAASFAELIDRGLAWRVRRGDVQDVGQLVRLRVWQKREQYRCDTDAQLRSWVLWVRRTEIWLYWKRLGRKPPRDDRAACQTGTPDDCSAKPLPAEATQNNPPRKDQRAHRAKPPPQRPRVIGLPGDPVAPPGSNEPPDTADVLRAGLDTLNMEERAALELCIVGGFTQRVASQILRISQTSVSELLKRARKRLHEYLTHRGY